MGAPIISLQPQGIEGAAAVAESVLRQRGNREITIWPVPMRVEDGETAKLEASRDLARLRLDHLLGNLDTEARDRYWGEVEVPYKTLYAYEETLAPIGDRPNQAGTILTASERLAAYLSGHEVTRQVPLPEIERLQFALRFERGRLGQPSPELADIVPQALEADTALRRVKPEIAETQQRLAELRDREGRLRRKVERLDRAGFLRMRRRHAELVSARRDLETTQQEKERLETRLQALEEEGHRSVMLLARLEAVEAQLEIEARISGARAAREAHERLIAKRAETDAQAYAQRLRLQEIHDRLQLVHEFQKVDPEYAQVLATLEGFRLRETLRLHTDYNETTIQQMIVEQLPTILEAKTKTIPNLRTYIAGPHDDNLVGLIAGLADFGPEIIEEVVSIIASVSSDPRKEISGGGRRTPIAPARDSPADAPGPAAEPERSDGPDTGPGDSGRPDPGSGTGTGTGTSHPT